MHVLFVVVLILTSSARFSVGGVVRGTSEKQVRRLLKGERRVKVGKNVWYAASSPSARLLVKTQGGRAREVGIGDKRYSRTLKSLKRFLRAWEIN